MPFTLQPFMQRAPFALELKLLLRHLCLVRLPLPVPFQPQLSIPKRLIKQELWTRTKSQPRTKFLSQPSFLLHPRIPPRRREHLRAKYWYWPCSLSPLRRTLRVRVQLKQQCLRLLPRLQQRSILLPSLPRIFYTLLLLLFLYFFYFTCTFFAFSRLYLMKSAKFLYISSVCILNKMPFHF